MSERASSKLFLAFLALVFILPLPMGGNRPMNSMVPMVLTYVLVILVAIDVLRGRRVIDQVLLNAKWLLLAFACVGVWALIQAYFLPLELRSWDAYASLEQAAETGMYLSVFGLCLVLVRSRFELEALMWVVVVAGVVQVLINLTWGQTGTFVNRNHFAGYLEMALALAMGLMLSRIGGGEGGSWRSSARDWVHVFLGPKIIIRVLIIILVIGLILSRSKMGNVGFFVGMGVAGFVGLWTFRQVSKNVVIFFASILTLDVILMGTFFGIDKLQQRFQQFDAATNVRGFLNGHSIQLLQDHWQFGTGAGTYYAAYTSVRDHRINGFVQHAHNDYFQFWVELGLGAFMLGFVVLHSAGTAIRVQLVRRSRFMKAVGFASLMGIVSIMVHATAEFNFQLTGNAATFMVLLALPYLALSLDRGGRGL